LNATRAPFELGCRPSPATITPAFTSSSLYFIMELIMASSGSSPASVLLSAFSKIMNFIGNLPVSSMAGRSQPRSVYTTSRLHRDRHARGEKIPKPRAAAIVTAPNGSLRVVERSL
jgi:hypothetical protein